MTDTQIQAHINRSDFSAAMTPENLTCLKALLLGTIEAEKTLGLPTRIEEGELFTMSQDQRETLVGMLNVWRKFAREMAIPLHSQN